ncbi:TSL-kinase interacting protein 1-like [Wolffia australiana]
MKLSSTPSSKIQTTASEKSKCHGPLPHHSSHKFKLQLFPVDDEIHKLLLEGGHNPYLELTLRPRKKIGSVLAHLTSKWAVFRAPRELVLSPYDCAELELIHGRTWTSDDMQTSAGDVFEAVGRPHVFRLKYGLRCKTEKLRRTETREKRSAKRSRFEDKTGSDRTVKEGVGNSLLSWADCVTGVSVGQLLGETSNVNPTEGTGGKHVVNSDSFDVAIANYIARNQESAQPPALPSIWEAEETRHAFPLPKAASCKDQISQDQKSEEPPKEQQPVSALGLLNFCWDSQGPFEYGGLARPMTGQDGPSPSGLDPFQSSSLFAIETAPSM